MKQKGTEHLFSWRCPFTFPLSIGITPSLLLLFLQIYVRNCGICSLHTLPFLILWCELSEFVSVCVLLLHLFLTIRPCSFFPITLNILNHQSICESPADLLLYILPTILLRSFVFVYWRLLLWELLSCSAYFPPEFDSGKKKSLSRRKHTSVDSVKSIGFVHYSPFYTYQDWLIVNLWI